MYVPLLFLLCLKTLADMWYLRKTLQIRTFILPDPKSYLIQYSGITNEELKYKVASDNKNEQQLSLA